MNTNKIRTGFWMFLHFVCHAVCCVVCGVLNTVTYIEKCVCGVVERTILRLLETRNDHEEENSLREQLYYLKNDLLFLETKFTQQHVHLMNCIKYKPIHIENDVHALVLSSIDGTFHLQGVSVYDEYDSEVQIQHIVPLNYNQTNLRNIMFVFRVPIQIKRIEFVQLKRYNTVYVTLYRCESMIPSSLVIETEIVSLNHHILCNTAVL